MIFTMQAGAESLQQQIGIKAMKSAAKGGICALNTTWNAIEAGANSLLKDHIVHDGTRGQVAKAAAASTAVVIPLSMCAFVSHPYWAGLTATGAVLGGYYYENPESIGSNSLMHHLPAAAGAVVTGATVTMGSKALGMGTQVFRAGLVAAFSVAGYFAFNRMVH